MSVIKFSLLNLESPSADVVRVDPVSTRPCPIILSRSLHLVVSLDTLLIRWRRGTLATLSTHGASILILRRRRNTSLLSMKLLVGRRSHGSITSLGTTNCLLCLAVIDVVVRHATILGILLADLFVCRIWVLQDNVPSVQKTGQHAETAQGEVDQRVGAADAAFYPD